MKHTPNGGLIALIFVGVISLVLISLVYLTIAYQNGFRDADQRHAEAFSQIQLSENLYESCARKRSVEDALHCYIDGKWQDREVLIAEQDLDAQQEMAIFAKSMVWVTIIIGVLTLSVSTCGVYWVRVTLLHTQEANRAALSAANASNESNSILRDEQRPWVSIGKIDAEIDHPLPIPPGSKAELIVPIHLTFDIENHGKLPALKVKHFGRAFLTTQQHPEGWKEFIETAQFPLRKQLVVAPTQIVEISQTEILQVEIPLDSLDGFWGRIHVEVYLVYRTNEGAENCVTMRTIEISLIAPKGSVLPSFDLLKIQDYNAAGLLMVNQERSQSIMT